MDLKKEIMSIQKAARSFVALVAEMRDNQKQYFATRQKKYLFKSKELEKKVDDFLDLCNIEEWE